VPRCYNREVWSLVISNPCGGGVNTSTVTLRVVGGDEKGSLKSETVKYGRKSQGTHTREILRWQWLAACTKDRPLVREGVPQKTDRNCGHEPHETYWLTHRQSQCDFDLDSDLVISEDDRGVEYLHRDPAIHRRRRNGKSQIWDSKIWSRVPRDSHPRKTALARARSIYKRQTRILVREGAPQKQDRNCQTVINIWAGTRHQDLLTDWPTVSRSVTLILTLT
jgi:hypothetical protein